MNVFGLRSLLSLCCAVGALTTGAAAQDLIFSAQPTESCLSIASDPGRCIGASADQCMTETPGGETTVGMGGCLWAEAQYWDTRLNRAYTGLRALEQQADADDASYGLTTASRADALRDMQRAWIAFRDATCAYEATQWGGGTGAGPASNACWMMQTGRQALVLEARLSEMTP
ncbi:lysozyme inhibitor LprI family protein [Jannaschia sp. 2305UL9-9]|uniref:lysozyme inhibitor LprI family protein n=1 Tax=Jannaschia sp. 2305UL9-9 TaxID=3121638 RepID=UPI0035287484